MLDDLSLNLCKENFRFFRELILKEKQGRMHDEIIDTASNDPRNLVVLAARGHSKTRTMSVAFPLWMMWKKDNKKEFFIILSASMDQSTDILEAMKREIVEKDELRKVLLPERGLESSWSQTKITTKNGHRVMVAPFGSSIRGRHPTYAICDDVQKREQSNPQFVKDTFFGDVFPVTAAKKGKHIIIGTPMFYDDLFAELQKPQYSKEYVYLRYPAVISNPDGSWLKPQFPELYTLDQLRTIKNSTPLFIWYREFCLEITSSELSLFPYELITKATELQLYPTKEKKYYFMGCDIAMSEKSGADYSAFIVGCKQGSNPLNIEHIEHFKGKSSKEQVELIRKLNRMYHFSKIWIEQKGIGMGIVKDLQGTEVTPVLFPFDTNHKNKEDIFSNLEMALRQDRIKLPKSDTLIKELINIGITRKKRRDGSYEQRIEGISGSHDDLAIALALVYAAYHETQQGRPYISFV